MLHRSEIIEKSDKEAHNFTVQDAKAMLRLLKKLIAPDKESICCAKSTNTAEKAF